MKDEACRFYILIKAFKHTRPEHFKISDDFALYKEKNPYENA